MTKKKTSESSSAGPGCFTGEVASCHRKSEAAEAPVCVRNESPRDIEDTWPCEGRTGPGSGHDEGNWRTVIKVSTDNALWNEEPGHYLRQCAHARSGFWSGRDAEP